MDLVVGGHYSFISHPKVTTVNAKFSQLLVSLVGLLRKGVQA